MLGDMALVAFFVAIPFAFAAAYYDLRTMELPHWLAPAAAVAFGAIIFIALPYEAAIWRVVGALFVLFVGFLLYLANAMGGGDAKVAAAFALMIAPVDAAFVLIVLSVCSLVNIVVIWGLRRSALAAAGGGWAFLGASGRYPYAVALGEALVIYLALVAFLVN